MIDSSWDLVIPVLVIGLTLGVVWVILSRRRAGAGGDRKSRDRELIRADLEARHEALLQQLREAGEEDREELELAAARNLKALEEVGGGAGVSAHPPPAASTDEGSATPARRGMPAWASFVGGVATAALVGILIVWAGRDATPRVEEGVMRPPRVEEHPEGPQLSGRDAEALEHLAEQILEDPTDLVARKQYAVGLLSTGQFFEAFEQAEVLLASNPRDPDGLYVKAMVRMRMGIEPEARSLLETLLVDYPEHVPALTAMGVLVLREQGLEAAEGFWERAQEASGGDNPEIERLIETARRQVEEQGGSGPASVPAEPEVARAPRPAAPRPAESQPLGGPAYTLHLEVAPGSAVPATALLFVSLRGAQGGPPSAVKRIDGPRFPMTLTLSAADTMMGQPLPEEGTVTVRVDFDGNASTRDEAEPEGSQQMRIGESVRLILQ